MSTSREILICVCVLLCAVEVVRSAIADGDCSADPSTEKTKCEAITNAICNGTVCNCVKGYEENKVPDPATCDPIGLDGTCTDKADCKNVANADCSTAKTCQCSDGYIKQTDSCVKAVSGKTCSAQGSECNSITNSECHGTQCQCKQGYKENADKCNTIFGSDCTTDGDCTGLDHSVCTDKKCKCTTDYAQKDNICLKVVSSNTCSAGGNQCNSIQNSECDEATTKCKCSDGFVENANTCDAKSGAVEVKSAVGLVFGSLIMLLVRAL